MYYLGTGLNSNVASKARVPGIVADALPAGENVLGIVLLLYLQQTRVIVAPERLFVVRLVNVRFVLVRAAVGSDLSEEIDRSARAVVCSLFYNDRSRSVPTAFRDCVPDRVSPGWGYARASFSVWNAERRRYNERKVKGDIRERVHDRVNELSARFCGREVGGRNEARGDRGVFTDGRAIWCEYGLVERAVTGEFEADDFNTGIIRRERRYVVEERFHGSNSFCLVELWGHVGRLVWLYITAETLFSPRNRVLRDNFVETADSGGVGPGESGDSKLQGQSRRSKRCCLENDSKRSASASAKSPEEISILALVGGKQLSIRSDELELENTVDPET